MSNVATGLPVVFYTYVTAGVEPPEPEEGETWYDTAADESKVYDGAQWNVQNIESHAALSGISPDDHHQRYQDSEASAAAPVQSVNGEVGDVTDLATDADLSAHESDNAAHHSPPTTTTGPTRATTGRTERGTDGAILARLEEIGVRAGGSGFTGSEGQVTVVYEDGTSVSFSPPEISFDETRWFNLDSTKTVLSISTSNGAYVSGWDRVLSEPHEHDLEG